MSKQPLKKARLAAAALPAEDDDEEEELWEYPLLANDGYD
jgi:hypothetical protein